MKAICFFLATSLAALLGGIAPSFAQTAPVLNADNFAPVVGSTVKLQNARRVANIDSLTLDTGQNFNLTYEFAPTYNLNVTLYPYNLQLSRAASFPTATYAYEGGPSATRTLYYRQDAEGISQIGEDAYILTTFFDPGIVQIPFGLSYGQTKIYHYEYLAQINTVTPPLLRYKRVSDTITYAGYGSVILNGVNHENCVLIRHKTGSRDTAAGATAATLNTIWTWYKPRLVYPLLQFSYAPSEPASITYAVNIVTTVAPALGQKLHVYPNPAKGKLVLDGQSNEVRLISSTGAVYMRPVHMGQADLTGLAPGLYVVHYDQRQAKLVIE
jgi:hypothetical protein